MSRGDRSSHGAAVEPRPTAIGPPRGEADGQDSAHDGAPAGAPRTSRTAVASLVLGILGLVVPLVCAVLAIVLGALGLGETKRDPRARGVGPATAGLTLGIIGLAWWTYLLILLLMADWV